MKTLFTILILMSIETHADGKPAWVNQIPAGTSEFYFVVGIGQGRNLDEAKESAENQAADEIIRIVIGTRGSISTSVQITNESTSIHSKVELKNYVSRVKGLETRGIHTEESNGSITFYVLKAFPKKEIKALYSKIEKTSKSNLGIAIKSEPAGARVFIDGAYMGMTPFHTVLQKATYGLRLQKPGFLEVDSKLEISGDSNINANFYLVSSGQATGLQISNGIKFENIKSEHDKAKYLMTNRQWGKLASFCISWKQQGTDNNGLPEYYLGIAYLNLKQFKLALNALIQISNEDANDIVMRTICETLIGLQNYSSAVDFCKLAIEMNPGNADGYGLKARAYKAWASSDYLNQDLYSRLSIENYQAAYRITKWWRNELINSCNAGAFGSSWRCSKL